MRKEKLFLLGMLLVSFLLMAINAQAECSSECQQYCGQGYCTDYIFSRLHVRQHGNAKQWKGNISSSEVQPGDVAIFISGSYGHVAYVESVDGDNITISEWNFGGCNTDRCDQTCGVTDNYGRTTTRVVSISSVTRFWRPKLSLFNDSTPIILETRRVSNLAWYPPNKTCVNAEKWMKIQDGRAIQEFGDNSICYQTYIQNPIYEIILLGTGELPEQCTE